MCGKDKRRSMLCTAYCRAREGCCVAAVLYNEALCASLQPSPGCLIAELCFDLPFSTLLISDVSCPATTFDNSLIPLYSSNTLNTSMAPVSRAASEAAKPQTRRQSGVKDAPKSKDGPKKATTPLKVKPATEKKEKPAAAKKAKASHPPFLEMIQVSLALLCTLF